MIDKRIQLFVVHDNGGNYSDLSDKACDFARDPFTFSLTETDYLYVGFKKPINAFYSEITTGSETDTDLVPEYYTGSQWLPVPSYMDETNAFSRSGYLTWDKPTDWQANEVDGTLGYWIRLRSVADTTAVTFRGLNLVFCDDATLKQEFYEIDNVQVLPRNEASHIMSHVSARNDIVQELRNRGYLKMNPDTGLENLTQWDLLDLFEIREAAKFKALAIIFFNLSDDMDDHWFGKHEEYADKYKKVLQGIRLSVDENDDGKKDTSEKLNPIKITRLIY